MNAQAMPKTHPSEAAARPAFGTVLASQMAVVNYKDGRWSEHEFSKYGPLMMSPAIHGLHYGSTCFEGFKAYRWADGSINVFRMDKHIARMQRSLGDVARGGRCLDEGVPLSLGALLFSEIERECNPLGRIAVEERPADERGDA